MGLEITVFYLMSFFFYLFRYEKTNPGNSCR